MIESPRDINIRINTGTIVRFFGIIILLLAISYFFDVVLVVLAAVVIASAMEPAVRRMKRRGIHRVVAIVMIYIVLAIVVASILIFLVPVLARDAVQFLNSFPQSISLERLWSPISSVGLNLGTNVSQSFSGQTFSVADFVRFLQDSILGNSASAFATASVLFGGLLSFILIVVLSFYLAVQEEGVGDFLRIVAPVKHHEYINDLWKRSQRKIALWLQGQVILGLLIGLLVYIVLLAVGIPHALLLAVVAGLFEIIPIFGPVISSIPAILLAFSDRGLGTGVLLVCLYLIIYQFESQIFYPLVVKKVVGISPIVVILALVIGAKLAGVLGALIAVPLAGAFMEYVNDIEKYKKLN